MSIHEECGVFGVISPHPTNAAQLVYYGLYALQHRGQESCGIVVNDDGVFASRKDLGLVGEVFSEDALSRLPGEAWQWVMSATVRQGPPAAATASLLRSTTKRGVWRLPTMAI